MDRASFSSSFGTSHGLLAQQADDPWMDDIEGLDIMSFFSSVFDDDEDLSNFVSNQQFQGVDAASELTTIQNQAIDPIKDDNMASMNTYNGVTDSGMVTAAQRDDDNTNKKKLSTVEILKMAGERFIQFAAEKNDGISTFIHPYYGPSLTSDLSADEARDVELIRHLFASAEQVSLKQFDVANRLIARCLWCASDIGTPVQRLTFYFAEALKEKIEREYSQKKGLSSKEKHEDRERALATLSTNEAWLSLHQAIPCHKLLHFTGIQAIVDNIKAAKRLHLIDLQLRSGIQWSCLMQALSDHFVEHLAITAVGTHDMEEHVEETGKRLKSFAQAYSLNFTFRGVYLSDMSEFRQDLIRIEPDETVAVYSFITLRSMLCRPNCLETLTAEIAKLNPAVMVVTEVEANHNSPLFTERFVEALFFYGAYFDCLKECMGGGGGESAHFRTVIERAYFALGMRSIVAMEGEDRSTRSVKVDVWRAFFERFGMREIELSESSKYQAKLILEQSEHGSCCTVEYSGKGVLVGWKGTPFFSLTAWRFRR